jgi:hypothetical protein
MRVIKGMTKVKNGLQEGWAKLKVWKKIPNSNKLTYGKGLNHGVTKTRTYYFSLESSCFCD